MKIANDAKKLNFDLQRVMAMSVHRRDHSPSTPPRRKRETKRQTRQQTFTAIHKSQVAFLIKMKRVKNL